MDAVNELLNKAGAIIADRLREDIRNKQVTKYGAVNASGNLANSVRYDVKDSVLRVYANDYIYYVEKGRKPGKKPPRAPIEQWVEVKLGIVDEKKRNSIAFLIQRKIGEQGTEAYKQGGTNLVEDILSPELIAQIRSDLFLLMRDITIRELKSAITGLKQAA